MLVAVPSEKMSDLTSDSLRLLVESVQDYAIFLLDVEGHVTTWNRGAERIKGYSASEIIGKHFSVFYPQADIAAGKPQNELRVASEVGSIEDEGWRLHKNGSRFWANVLITALRDPGGELKGFGKVTRDLTERRAAAEELRRSEERFRVLIEGIQDYAIYLLDPTGVVSTWNPGAERTKGYTASEIIGRHYSAFFTPEDVRAGRPQRELELARTAGRFEEESWRVRKDGTRFWANVVLTRLLNANGELVGFAKVTRDLTARKQAEETAQNLLREQAARTFAEETEARITEERERFKALSKRLEVILETIADAITVQNRSGELIFANSAAARTAGFQSVPELVGARLDSILERFEILDQDGIAFAAEELPGRRVLKGEPTSSVVVQVRDRRTGHCAWFAIRANPVLGKDGTPELAVNIWHDVTSDRRREEHERYLARATVTLASSLDYELTLRSLAELLVPGLADWCSIHLLSEDQLRPVAVAHADPARVERVREFNREFPPNREQPNGAWNVVRTGQAELRSEITDESLAKAAEETEQLSLLRELGMRSLLIVPIRVRDRVLGTLSLVSTKSGRNYDRAHLALAEELGRRAGTSIENARLYASERKARERLELIARAGEVFSGTLDYELTLTNVVDLTLPALADFAFFDVVEASGVRRVAAAHEDPAIDDLIKRTRWSRSECADRNLCALTSGVSGFHPQIDDTFRREMATSPEHLELLQRLKLGSMVTVPMRVGVELVGALTVCFGKSGRHHTSEDLKLSEELARRAGIAIAQARLYAQAQASAKAAAEAARAAEEASRVKDEFLATVSHELRTPLNAILGWASLIRNRNEDPGLAKGLDVVCRNAQAQGKIIDDILDVSRIITGKLKLDLKPTDLLAVVQDAIEVVRPSASAKRISIELSSQSETCLLVADPERLQQVIWNLLSNAVKFTDSGGSIRIVVARENSKLHLRVIDSGRGIDPEFLPYVFDRFKQADASTTRRVGGLGLGLAIVRHIVELHGGQVAASSSGPGTGATFSITLPIRAISGAVSDETATLSTQSAGDELAGDELVEPAAPLRGLRVLVVDDEPDARELLQVVLEHAGARVKTAESAAQALDLLQRFRPGVLVSDIGMPDQDGYDLMRTIRALDPALGGGIPSIALTAYARSEDKTKALAVGFTTHIGKPVNVDDLLSAVANLAQFSPKSSSTPAD